MVVDPLIHGRLLFAVTKPQREQVLFPGGQTGMIVWASVSDRVHAMLEAGISAAVFPVGLIGDDWNSGEKIWIFDVIVPTEAMGKIF